MNQHAQSGMSMKLGYLTKQCQQHPWALKLVIYHVKLSLPCAQRIASHDLGAAWPRSTPRLSTAFSIIFQREIPSIDRRESIAVGQRMVLILLEMLM